MAVSSQESLLYLCIFVFVSSLRSGSAASLPVSPIQSAPFLYNLQSKCPISIAPNPPLEINGYLFERSLTNKRGNVYTVVLFYASWCPFSHDAHLAFEALSSMFPQMEHLAVEQSVVMPSVLSRYGIHSLPTILMANQTAGFRYCGPKDLHTLVRYYKKITGYEPLHYVPVDQSTSSENRARKGLSPNGILTRDPYFLFSMMFIFIRVLVFLVPKAVSHFRAFWASYAPQLNLEIFRETSQISGRVLHLINVKQIWAQMRLWKTRNLCEGAKNARVWASTLASSVS